MYQALLVIIYIAFISLGLPDALLGSAWPTMYGELNVPISYSGIVSMIIAGGTIFSSLFSDRLIRKFGTGAVTVVSVAMTAAALLGFSISHSFYMLCLWAIPYGLGAGSVDAALNNFVALHYKSRHMSWLHSFWGVGATAGPYIMGLCLTAGRRWNSGYLVICVIQTVLVLFLILSLPLWRKQKETETLGAKAQTQKVLKMTEIIKRPGARPILIAFFCYCALESTAGLWASSYMVLYKGISAETAAKWAALFYLGITIGRFLCGFVSDRLGDQMMIRLGQVLAFLGALLLVLPFGNTMTIAGLVLIGTGCAPIYPSLLHETPVNFGAELSQSMIGAQMACAYVGSTLMPPLFGFISERITMGIYPFYLLLLAVLMFVMTERVHQILGKKSHVLHLQE
mgnify:CR=1 FL=1